MQRHRFTAWLEPHTSTCVGDCMYIVLRFWRSSVRTRLVSDAGCTRWAHLGQWDWNCLGCFLFLAVAIVIPGAGWVCIALAALALWLLAKSGIRQQEGYGFGASAPRPVSQPVSYPAPQPVSYPAAQPVPQSPLYSAPQPVSQPVSRTETSVSQPVSQPVYQSMPSVMPGTVPSAMPGTVPNGPFAPDRMNATAYAPTESKRRKPAGPIVVLSILGLTFLSFAGLMGLIWVNDMGIIGIMRLSTIWIAAVCIVMGLVVIILGFRGRRTGGLIPLGLVAGGCALCMTIVSGTYGVYYRDFGASGINTVVSLSQSVSARNSDGMNDVQKDGIFVADASDATFETLQQGVAFSGENYNTDQAIIDWSDWGKTHGPHHHHSRNTGASAYRSAGFLHLRLRHRRLLLHFE